MWKAADDGTISLVGEPQAHRQLKDAKAYVESLIDPSLYVQADLWAGLELSSPALHFSGQAWSCHHQRFTRARSPWCGVMIVLSTMR